MMNLEEYVGQVIEFEAPDFIEDDRLTGKVTGVVPDGKGNWHLVVKVGLETYEVYASQITGTGFE